MGACRKPAKPKQPKNGRRDQADDDECEEAAKKKQIEKVGGEEVLEAASPPLDNAPSSPRHRKKRRCGERGKQKARLVWIRLGWFFVHGRREESPNRK